MRTWRLIIDGPSKGNFNMAADEALLDSFIEKNSLPTLRIYSWESMCLSLGYFQNINPRSIEKLKENNIDLVRRPTGGRGVLHTDEITYSIIIGEEYPDVSKNVTTSYKQLIKGIELGLEYLGLSPELMPLSQKSAKKDKNSSVCFDSPSWYELLIDGKKVVGSAQMRRKGAILQHGSIKLKFDSNLVSSIFGTNKIQKEYLKKAACGIFDFDPSLTKEECVSAILRGFERAFEIQLVRENYNAFEKARTNELSKSKYSLNEWNFKRSEGVF
ncbi:lipoate--protein ligase family protein [Natranaerofaba carboxydovora]|uniref:lipoate--protein ligase family protein n=1 Tax=Natranaerofaba carboxydovora TaxID=2742683 RepID=UPI001F12EC40|nr:biotin/lipoate A/B protein ligase family protein [Natranaerofaba carboxydovora]